ncbi:MAG: hypothetical protein LUH14_02010 [Clostridiaceae bacterium]|nr:hypothetical protein [Clostridiaceae bacterium]
MLKKLLYHDLKAEMRFAGMFAGIVFAICVLSGVLKGVADAVDTMPALRYAAEFTMLFGGLAVFAMVVSILIYLLLFYRKNLFKDEGYLMHTLPVTPGRLFWSKVISSYICLLFAFAVAYICVGALCLKLNWGVEVLAELRRDLPQESAGFVAVLLIYLFLLSFAVLIVIFSSITIGNTIQLGARVSVNRDILSVLVYAVIYFIQQIASSLVLLFYFLFRYKNLLGGFSQFASMADNEQVKADFFRDISVILGAAGSVAVLLCVGLSVISIHRLNKKLNMD